MYGVMELYICGVAYCWDYVVMKLWSYDGIDL